MEVVTLKLDKHMLDNMDETLKKHNFSTRTEFIRDAIREKLEQLTKEELIKEFLSLKGKAKNRITDEELKKIKETIFKNIAKDKNWN